jgi:hypothetical protein
VGRQATASDSHSQKFSRLFFFSSYLWWDNNQTTPACWNTYWNCIARELGTLCGVFLFVCFVLCCFVLFFPFWWDNNGTTSETPSTGLEAEGRTLKLLRLKLYCIWTWRFFKIYLYFYFFISIFFIFIFVFYFQPYLCLSNACSAYYWLEHYLSLFIALKLFCLFLSFFLLTCYSIFLCFLSPLNLPF